MESIYLHFSYFSSNTKSECRKEDSGRISRQNLRYIQRSDAGERAVLDLEHVWHVQKKKEKKSAKGATDKDCK